MNVKRQVRPRSLTGDEGLRSTTWYNWAEGEDLKIQLM